MPETQNVKRSEDSNVRIFVEDDKFDIHAFSFDMAQR